jgi:hypothetical protein
MEIKFSDIYVHRHEEDGNLFNAKVAFENCDVTQRACAQLKTHDTSRVFAGRIRIVQDLVAYELEERIEQLLISAQNKSIFPQSCTDEYLIDVILWQDNCEAQTAICARILDSKYELFPDGMSNVIKILGYIGGEHFLPNTIPMISCRLIMAYQRVYIVNKTNVRIRKWFNLCDHHAGNVMNCQLSGRNVFRDIFSHSISPYYSNIAYHSKPQFQQCYRYLCFENFQMTIDQWVKEQALLGHTKTVSNTAIARFAHFLAYFRVSVHSPPLLLRNVQPNEKRIASHGQVDLSNLIDELDTHNAVNHHKITDKTIVKLCYFTKI